MLILSVISFKINKISQCLIYRCENGQPNWADRWIGWVCLTVTKYLSLHGKDFACLDPDHGPLALAQLFPQQILYHRTILLQNIQPHASAFMIIPQFLTIDLMKRRNSWAIQQIVDTPGQCPLLSGIRKRYRCRIHLRKPAALRMSFHFQFLHDLLDTGRRCSIIYYHYNAPLYSHRFNKIPSASEIHLWLSALS